MAVSGPDPVSSALLGRSGELERISSFVAESSRHGASLLIFGDPGVGKSALLDVAAGICTGGGGQVLAAVGVEHEAEIAFSTLSLLLHPVRASLAELELPYRQSLSVVLGLADGPAPSRLLAANAVLELLRQTANRDPLLVIIDDLQWMDRSSAAILGLVSRRLAETRIGFLAAARTGESGFFESSGLPEVRVEALDRQSAGSLVDAAFPGLASPVRSRVLAESAGNPLALLELPESFSVPERAAEQGLPDVLPLGRKLQATFAARLTQLPEPARELLLLAALDGTGDLLILHGASAATSGIDVLAPAERAHLVRVDDSAGRVTFRHPLVRAAVVGASTSAERRHAHRALAHQLTSQPERRAWHLAASCVQPDETISALLEDTAASVLRRGDAVGAVAALIRAADLHPSGDRRGQLLAEAAFVGAGVAGDLRSVPGLLADARRADPQHGESLQAAVAASYALLNGDGDVLTAHRLLTSAIESHIQDRSTLRGGPNAGDRGADHSALIDALHSLLTVCSWAERADLWPPLLSAIDLLGPELPSTLHLRVHAQGDPARLDAATLAEFDRVVRALPEQADPARTAQIAIAALYIDRVDDCREPLWRVVRDGRAGGAVTSAIRAMMALSVEDFAVGQWDEADALALEGLRLCDTHGYGLPTWFLRLGQALVAAGRGEEDLVRSLTEQMMRWATPRRVGAVQMFARHARGLSALGRGAFEEAYQHLCAISAPGTLPPYTAYALKIPLDLVESAVRSGRPDEAVAHLRAMRDAGLPALSGHLALMTAAAAALCASDDEAPALFQEALNVPAADRWPFDLARVHLAYGERLRRNYAPGAAWEQLGMALDVFQDLGARPWAERAAAELRACGQTRRRNDYMSAGVLTSQEREIALMAASGLSNKAIGERLSLSHRTIGTHLYRAFPKLGITSRAALRDALKEDRDGSLPKTGLSSRGARTFRTYPEPVTTVTIAGPDLRRFLDGLPGVDSVGAEARAAVLASRSIKTTAKRLALDLAISMIDLTTLEGQDTPGKVRAMCAKAKHPDPTDPTVPTVAAVCVYPDLAAVAAAEVKGTGIHVASVATGFPSGRASLDVKLADVRSAIAAGADEIDMVIDRGAFLAGDYQLVFDEIAAVHEVCEGTAHLKVILETGELVTLDNVRRASWLAMLAGADFIKTSTGKVTPAATLPVTLVMLEAVRDYRESHGRQVGVKAAGGIRTAKDAIRYLVLVNETVGDDWLDPDWFRLGASSLLNDLLMQRTKLTTGRYSGPDYFTLDS